MKRKMRTYEGNLDVFETSLMIYSDVHGSFDRIHGGIASDIFTVCAMCTLEIDVNGGLAVRGDVANFVSDLIANGMHGAGMHRS